jgi:hypothetical protein
MRPAAQALPRPSPSHYRTDPARRAAHAQPTPGPSPAAAIWCHLTFNFQPAGAKNVPWGWTLSGQKSLPKPNNASWDLMTIKLAPFPVPLLHVGAAHPFLDAPPMCVAECLAPPKAAAPATSKGSAPASGAKPGRHLRQAVTSDAKAASPQAGLSGLPPDADKYYKVIAAPTAPATPALAAVIAPEAAKAPGPAPTPVPAPAKGGSSKAAAPPPPPPPCATPADPGNLMQPGTWNLTWALDGGKSVTLGPFAGSAAAAEIKLDMLTGLPKVRGPPLRRSVRGHRLEGRVAVYSVARADGMWAGESRAETCPNALA